MVENAISEKNKKGYIDRRNTFGIIVQRIHDGGAEGEQDGNTAAGGGGWLGRGERIYQIDRKSVV